MNINSIPSYRIQPIEYINSCRNAFHNHRQHQQEQQQPQEEEFEEEDEDRLTFRQLLDTYFSV